VLPFSELGLTYGRTLDTMRVPVRASGGRGATLWVYFWL